MIFNVAGLLTDMVGATRRAELAEQRLVAGNTEFTGIKGDVTLMRTDRTVLVTAKVTAAVSIECSRCTAPAAIGVDLEFEEEFTPTNADLLGNQWDEYTETDYDPALLIDERNQLDLAEALGQAMEAALPIAPLCSEECRGICPVCWTNRNETDCDCEQLPMDPRWEALASLDLGSAKSPE